MERPRLGGSMLHETQRPQQHFRTRQCSVLSTNETGVRALDALELAETLEHLGHALTVHPSVAIRRSYTPFFSGHIA